MLAQPLQRVEQPARALVHGVVVGECDHVDTGLRKPLREAGIALEDDVLPGLRGAVVGQRCLKVDEAEVARLKEGRHLTEGPGRSVRIQHAPDGAISEDVAACREREAPFGRVDRRPRLETDVRECQGGRLAGRRRGGACGSGNGLTLAGRRSLRRQVPAAERPSDGHADDRGADRDEQRRAHEAAPADAPPALATGGARAATHALVCRSSVGHGGRPRLLRGQRVAAAGPRVGLDTIARTIRVVGLVGRRVVHSCRMLMGSDEKGKHSPLS